LQRRELRFERRQPVVELRSQLINLLLKLLRLIGALRGGLMRSRKRHCGNRRGAHAIHRSHTSSRGPERDPRANP
jgi:hypothetical protein